MALSNIFKEKLRQCRMGNPIPLIAPLLMAKINVYV